MIDWKQATWEKIESLPKFVHDYFGDDSKLGKRLPPPKRGTVYDSGKGYCLFLSFYWDDIIEQAWNGSTVMVYATEDSTVLDPL